jgi:hypothetical protein
MNEIYLNLGKNRKEAGHTVSYGSMNSVLNLFGKRNGYIGDIVILTLNNNTKLTFKFNQGGRCFCGIKGNAKLVLDRSRITITDIRFV